MAQMTLTALQGIPIIRQGDDLAEIILDALHFSNIDLRDDDILVITQKIVSKAEDRIIELTTIQPSTRAKRLGIECEKDPRIVEMVLQESRSIMRVRPGILIVEHRLGFVCANAGIDQSNVQDQTGGSGECISLLPADPDASAEKLRLDMESRSNSRLGVLIIDSHGRAWRNGTCGVAIGMSGVQGIEDLRGQPDLFGRRLHITTVGVADELAAAASLVMGQAKEGTPVIHVRGFPYPLREGSMNEILRPAQQDLFR